MPNYQQQQMIENHFGCCRLVWNLALETKNIVYKANKTILSRYQLQKQLVDLKNEYDWLYEINSQSLQSVLMNLEIAFKDFYKGVSGFPKFKSKKDRQSFQCPQNVKIINDSIKLPIIGLIKFINTREFVGKIKTVTISRTATGKYFVSILVDDSVNLPIKPQIKTGNTIGIDVGIKSFVITSDGRSFEPNRYLKNSLKRLQCLHRRASRKQKGSNNRKKANKCVAILHEKIANQRADYIHKITTQLIRDNQAESFVIENLNVAGMLKNEKLSRSIHDASFGEFFRQMKYKCEWYGKNLIIIDRFAPSSKRCSYCGKINDTLTLADREWICECGAAHDRDLNAAKNIKWFGLNNLPMDSREEPAELYDLNVNIEAGIAE